MTYACFICEKFPNSRVKVPLHLIIILIRHQGNSDIVHVELFDGESHHIDDVLPE